MTRKELDALIQEARVIAKLLCAERRAAWADVLDCHSSDRAVRNQLKIDVAYQRAQAFLEQTKEARL